MPAGVAPLIIDAVRRSILALLALACAVRAAVAQTADSTLRILQLDVGQGDAALVITPERRTLLIDAGRSPREVAATLMALGVDTLHLVVASHAHSDHIGGMAAVLERIPVQAYLDNGIPHTTSTYRRTLSAIERTGARYLAATSRTITLGSLTVRVLAPPLRGDQNNGSVGLLLTFGEFRALYTGDSERLALDAWLRRESIPNVTLVKVAHHGARNGTSLGWVIATRPRAALVSVGPNGYGHPAPDVEWMWSTSGARVYRTDQQGTIEVVARRDGRVVIRTAAGATDSLARRIAEREQ
ncbi:MAG: ComEC/Rec2 family competence protein [Gemmatimonadaceae bacterium]